MAKPSMYSHKIGTLFIDSAWHKRRRYICVKASHMYTMVKTIGHPLEHNKISRRHMFEAIYDGADTHQYALHYKVLPVVRFGRHGNQVSDDMKWRGYNNFNLLSLFVNKIKVKAAHFLRVCKCSLPYESHEYYSYYDFLWHQKFAWSLFMGLWMPL